MNPVGGPGALGDPEPEPAIQPEPELVGELRPVGEPLDRVDGLAKVTGAAEYPTDRTLPGLVHAVLVRSTVATGRMPDLATTEAEASPGVLAVLTHLNAPKLYPCSATAGGTWAAPPLQDDRVLHWGQPVAVVVARTPEQAAEAAHLVGVTYEDAEDALLDLDDPRALVLTDPWQRDVRRGEVERALARADVRYDETFTTVDNTANPLGLFATVAAWNGDSLLVYDSTQAPLVVRRALAATFDVPEEGVRVVAPCIGGAFGAGLRTWPHVMLAALAARTVGHPVKLVLTRPQMFSSLGHRPRSVQRLRIGVDPDGRLLAVDHESTTPTALEDDNDEPVTPGTTYAYACPNLSTQDRQVRLNIPCPGWMRAPGTAQGNFAVESALDELAHRLGIDPVELRLRNYAGTDPRSGRPWSSNALRECYAVGAERFGWSDRDPRPGSRREGRWLVGRGMAGVSFPWSQLPCQARVVLHRDGTAMVSSAVADPGTGIRTVITQLTAGLLGLDPRAVSFELGDSDLPAAPPAGGSGLTVALSAAVHDACRRLVGIFAGLARQDAASPLYAVGDEDLAVSGGRIHLRDDPAAGESYLDLLARHGGLHELGARGAGAPPEPEEQDRGRDQNRNQDRGSHPGSGHGTAPAGAFAAHFVEVRVDRDLGTIRVARVVSAVDGGRILNEKTARSQIVGGIVGGIGMALFEQTVTDAGTGRIANGTLSDYLVPVSADVPDIDVVFVGGPDRANPVGVKGIGEIGLVGIAAAVANAVHNATGRRIRSLPITLDPAP